MARQQEQINLNKKLSPKNFAYGFGSAEFVSEMLYKLYKYKN